MPNHKQKSPRPLKLASLSHLKHICKNSPASKKKSYGTDGVTTEQFKQNISANLEKIHNDLIKNEYHFSQLRFISIKKDNNKNRIICIPTARDKLVQRLLLHHLTYKTIRNESILRDRLGICSKISYGSYKGNSLHQAIDDAIKYRNSFPWVLKVDISAFFDNIDRNYLIKFLRLNLKKSSLLPLLEQVIECDIKTGNKVEREFLKANGIIPGKGLRQGMPLSPLLSNIILHTFDKMMEKKAFPIIRYVDDIVVFSDSKNNCEQYQDLITKKLQDLGLGIAAEKTQIKSPRESIIFLGIEIYKLKTKESYDKRIPAIAIESAANELRKYKSYSNVCSEGLNYPSLMKKMDLSIEGYKNTYSSKICNYHEFISRLMSMKKEVADSLLEEILTKKIFNALTSSQKNFLGLID